MNTAHNRLSVRRCINEVINQAKEDPAIILTESDLKCLLYFEIRNAFPELQHTRDESSSSHCVHSEISYFDREGYLRHRPDLVLLHPRDLSIERGLTDERTELPSKQFHAVGSSIVIELKFIKSNRERPIRGLQNDIDKARALNERFINEPEMFYMFMVIISRYRGPTQVVGRFLDKYRNIPNLEIIDDFLLDLPRED